MDARKKIYTERQTEALMILFKIISCHSWDNLQSLHEAFPGSRIEHVLYGIYVLVIEPGGIRRSAA